LPWSVELIDKYSEKWEWYSLGEGTLTPMIKFWEKVFKPLISDKLIIDTVERMAQLKISTEVDYGSVMDFEEYLKSDSKPLQRLRKIMGKIKK